MFIKTPNSIRFLITSFFFFFLSEKVSAFLIEILEGQNNPYQYAVTVETENNFANSKGVKFYY